MHIVFDDNNASSSREKCHSVTPTDSIMCSGSRQMIVLYTHGLLKVEENQQLFLMADTVLL